MLNIQNKTYVMYGFNKDAIVETGYFGKDLTIVQDMVDAKKFPSKKRPRQKGFGTPEQWLEFINADNDLNHGYKFHLVSVIS